jgi:biopolymer transport protein ExbD
MSTDEKSWQIRHEGSPQARGGLTLAQIVEGLRDGAWEPTDEVMGPADRSWLPIESHPQLAEIAADLEPPPPRTHPDETHLDMNALIDVCLVLLIFFMLTTSYVAAVQKVVPLPAQAPEKNKIPARIISPKLVAQSMIRVEASLDRGGKPVIRVQNRPVSVVREDGTLDGPRLTAELRPYVSGEHRTEMLLDAREISWGMYIAIQDAAKAAGVTMIHQNVGK